MIRKPMVITAMAILLLLPLAARAADPPICSAKAALPIWDAGAQPRATAPACGPVCEPQLYQSDEIAGNGSSCAAALSDLDAQGRAYAKLVCESMSFLGACSVQVFSLGACQTDTPTLFTQIGWVNFHCRDNTC